MDDQGDAEHAVCASFCNSTLILVYQLKPRAMALRRLRTQDISKKEKKKKKIRGFRDGRFGRSPRPPRVDAVVKVCRQNETTLLGPSSTADAYSLATSMTENGTSIQKGVMSAGGLAGWRPGGRGAKRTHAMPASIHPLSVPGALLSLPRRRSIRSFVKGPTTCLSWFYRMNTLVRST